MKKVKLIIGSIVAGLVLAGTIVLSIFLRRKPSEIVKINEQDREEVKKASVEAKTVMAKVKTTIVKIETKKEARDKQASKYFKD